MRKDKPLLLSLFNNILFSRVLASHPLLLYYFVASLFIFCFALRSPHGCQCKQIRSERARHGTRRRRPVSFRYANKCVPHTKHSQLTHTHSHTDSHTRWHTQQTIEHFTSWSEQVALFDICLDLIKTFAQ